MNDSNEAELDPPFEIIEPAEWVAPVVFNSPHSGRVYPRAFLSAARLDLTTLRRSEDSFVDELIAGRGRLRPAADAGPFPALLRGRQPRALRARPAHVRRPPAVLRQYALDAGRRAGSEPSPAWSGMLRKSTTAGFRRRRAAPHRDAVQALPSGAAPPGHARSIASSASAILVDCHSMPSTAGAKDERPRADVVIGDRYGTSCVTAVADTVETDAARLSATWSAATSPMRAASSPSTTATRRPASIRSSSRSTAPSTWTSGATSVRPRSAASPPTWSGSPTAWPRCRSRSCGRTGRRPSNFAAPLILHCSNSAAAWRRWTDDVPSGKRRPLRPGQLADWLAANKQRKRAASGASGPSLGRKRPRRAAGMRGNCIAALHQYAPASHKKQGVLTYYF